MATTQNTFTGDGSNLGPFSFTFKWLESTDIKVTVAGVLKTAGTHYNLQGLNYTTKTGGQVLFTAGNAPANGAAIVVYRQTDDSDLAATFYSGSAIRAQDLNNNFVQGLYVTQESSNNATTAIGTANTALTNSNTAISTANTALSTANTASTNASAAVSTANTANSNASAAVSTANTASSNATTAVNTANAATATANNAASDAATALSTANSALSTANTASTNATNAVNTANSASSAASSAVSTANTASTTASNAVSTANSAVSTANSAVSTANSAVSTANSAVSTANAAASAVASAILYDIVASVAAIPGSPANNDAVEITNSTGIESFSPLSGLPSGFVGNSALSVRLVYTTSGSTWNWIQYFPNDPETRYLKTGTGTVTSTNIADGTIVNADVNASAAIAGTKISPDFGSQTVQTTGIFSHALGTAGAPTITFTGDTNTGIYSSGADQVAISTNGTERLRVDSSGRVGIGATTVSDLLHLRAATTPHLRIDHTTTSSFGAVQFYEDTTQQASVGALGSTSSGVGGGNALQIWNFLNAPTVFATNNQERARIDSSGRLLVGTSTARSNFFNTTFSAGLQIEGASGGSSSLSIVRSDGGGGPSLILGRQNSGAVGGNTAVTVASSLLGGISFQGNDGSEFVEAAYIACETDATCSANDMPGRLVFSTTADGASSPTERMRITSAGQTRIGTRLDVNPDQDLGGSGDNRAVGFVNGTSGAIIATNAFNQTGTINHMRLYNGNGLVGSITTSGSATAYNTSSDYRLKENVVPLTGAADRLNQLQVHRFNFIADPDTTVDGFIAHEAQAVVPECVTGTKDEVDDEGNPVYQGIDQSKLVPLLTAALQEALAKIETLEQRLNDAGIA